jgi:hypothetical protein
MMKAIRIIFPKLGPSLPALSLFQDLGQELLKGQLDEAVAVVVVALENLGHAL